MAAVLPCRVWIMNILPFPYFILGITLLQILPSTLAQESGGCICFVWYVGADVIHIVIC